MEQEGNPAEIIRNFSAYGDIDKTISNFVLFFKNQFALDIPDSALVDKNFLVKNIRNFYRARGAEESFEFLFRILFSDEITFRYPGEELLRASDGRWQKNKFIKTAWTATVQSMEGRKIVGQTSFASCVLEKIIQTSEGGNPTAVIEISSIDGVFSNGETVSGNDINGNSVSFVLDITLDNIVINNAGSGYSVGDNVVFNPPTAGSSNLSAKVSELTLGKITGTNIISGGSGFVVGEELVIDNTGKLHSLMGISANIRVASVSAGVITGLFIDNVGMGYQALPNNITTGKTGGTGADISLSGTNIGGVKKIDIIQSGVGVSVAPNVDLSGSGDGLATGTGQINSVYTETEGSFVTTDSLLDSNRVLQDNDFFQDYSYVIKSNTSISQWEKVVKKILHPAGMKVFSAIDNISSLLSSSVSFSTSVTPVTRTILRPDQQKSFVGDALLLIGLLIKRSVETSPSDMDEILGSNWYGFEAMATSSPGFSVNKWGTQTQLGSIDEFDFVDIDFLNNNKNILRRRLPITLIVEAVVIEDFEDAPFGTGSPNSAFWTTITGGAISTLQSKIGTKSWLFSGADTLKNAGVITNNDKRKMTFWFYSDSGGADSGTDSTRLCTFYENLSGAGAAVHLNRTNATTLFIGAAEGLITTANDLQINQDQWYFVEFKIENELFELKVDNVIISSGNATGATLMDRVEIGHEGAQAINFSSHIDQLRVYDRF